MKNVIAIDIGGSKIATGLVDTSGNILYSNHTRLPAKQTNQMLLNTIIDMAEQMKQEYGPLDAEAVGIAIPGCCDPVQGIFIINTTTKIGDLHIVRELTPYFQLPIYIENDVNACAVGEKQFGCCKEESEFLWITVSNSCGGALFLGGQLYRGYRFCAGEVGHYTVEEQNPYLCGCGKYGHLEVHGSGSAIGRAYRERMNLSEDPSFQSREVGILARQGDPVAIDVFYQAGRYLGKAIAGITNTLNLQKAVLGGGVTMDYNLLEQGVLDAVSDNLFPYGNEQFRVEKTALGYHAGLIGAATLAIQNLI